MLTIYHISLSHCECDGAGNLLYKWEQLWDYRPRTLVFCPWRNGLASRMLPRVTVRTSTTTLPPNIRFPPFLGARPQKTLLSRQIDWFQLLPEYGFIPLPDPSLLVLRLIPRQSSPYRYRVRIERQTRRMTRNAVGMILIPEFRCRPAIRAISIHLKNLHGLGCEISDFSSNSPAEGGVIWWYLRGCNR